jgi:ABC-type microcin C transport system duplicated ATPase subunit YejF
LRAMRHVLLGTSLRIERGESVGLVGESGSGKSMTARSIARLLPDGADVRGSILFDGTEVTTLRGSELRAYRRRIAMVFQDPRAHINPVRSIGDFLTEELRTNAGVPRKEAERRATELLDVVGIADGARRLKQHPHELSGGLLQRVMIASALLSEPEPFVVELDGSAVVDVSVRVPDGAAWNRLVGMGARALSRCDALGDQLVLAEVFGAHAAHLDAVGALDATTDSSARRDQFTLTRDIPIGITINGK